jgi:hypothetical protein
MDMINSTTSTNSHNQINTQQNRLSTSNQPQNRISPTTTNSSYVNMTNMLSKPANQQISPTKSNIYPASIKQTNPSTPNLQQVPATTATPKYTSSFSQSTPTQLNSSTNLNNSNIQQQMNNKQIQFQP